MIYAIKSDLIITTSRKPSQITRRFAQFIRHYFDAVYINRGKMSFRKVVNFAKQEENSLLLILTETKGNPSNIDIYDVQADDENPIANIYFNISLPSQNNRINVDSSEIFFVNKSKSLDEFFDNLTGIDAKEHIEKNCIIITDDDENMAKAIFIDKNGQDCRYKVYIKGFNLNGD
ncbi:MAG: hypothetical protein Q4Q22_03300 [Methanosphaera sp.]|nr:hypothetical protein [Methanosphaera sp.]